MSKFSALSAVSTIQPSKGGGGGKSLFHQLTHNVVTDTAFKPFKPILYVLGTPVAAIDAGVMQFGQALDNSGNLPKPSFTQFLRETFSEPDRGTLVGNIERIRTAHGATSPLLGTSRIGRYAEAALTIGTEMLVDPSSWVGIGLVDDAGTVLRHIKGTELGLELTRRGTQAGAAIEDLSVLSATAANKGVAAGLSLDRGLFTSLLGKPTLTFAGKAIPGTEAMGEAAYAISGALKGTLLDKFGRVDPALAVEAPAGSSDEAIQALARGWRQYGVRPSAQRIQEGAKNTLTALEHGVEDPGRYFRAAVEEVTKRQQVVADQQRMIVDAFHAVNDALGPQPADTVTSDLRTAGKGFAADINTVRSLGADMPDGGAKFLARSHEVMRNILEHNVLGLADPITEAATGKGLVNMLADYVAQQYPDQNRMAQYLATQSKFDSVVAAGYEQIIKNAAEIPDATADTIRRHLWGIPTRYQKITSKGMVEAAADDLSATAGRKLGFSEALDERIRGYSAMRKNTSEAGSKIEANLGLKQGRLGKVTRTIQGRNTLVPSTLGEAMSESLKNIAFEKHVAGDIIADGRLAETLYATNKIRLTDDLVAADRRVQELMTERDAMQQLLDQHRMRAQVTLTMPNEHAQALADVADAEQKLKLIKDQLGSHAAITDAQHNLNIAEKRAARTADPNDIAEADAWKQKLDSMALYGRQQALNDLRNRGVKISEQQLESRYRSLLSDEGINPHWWDVAMGVLADHYAVLDDGLLVDREAAAYLGAFLAGKTDSMKALQQVQGVTSYLRAAILTSPKFATRNMLGAILVNMFHGVRLKDYRAFTREFWSDPAGWAADMKYLVSVMPSADRQVALRMGQKGVEATLWDRPTLRALNTWGNRFEDFSVLKRAVTGDMGANLLGKNSIEVETAVRGAAFMKLTRQMHLDPETAWQQVRKMHVDYSDISKLDINIKQVIPFWMFVSRNLVNQVDMLMSGGTVGSRLEYTRQKMNREQAKLGDVLPNFAQQSSLNLGGGLSISLDGLNQFGDVMKFTDGLTGPVISTYGGVHPALTLLTGLGQNRIQGQTVDAETFAGALLPMYGSLDAALSGKLPGGATAAKRTALIDSLVGSIAVGAAPRAYGR